MNTVIEATTDRKRIHTRGIPFAMKDKAKSISGFAPRFDKTVTPSKFLGWSYPLTIDTCHALRRVFGRDLLIHAPLSEWYREEMQRLNAIEEIRSGEKAEMPRVLAQLPEMYAAIQARQYQTIGAAFIKHGEAVCLGDDPGLGKTIQTLAALVEKGCQRILIACPKTTTSAVWSREVNKWAPNIMPFVAQGTRLQRDAAMAAFEDTPYLGPKMLIINTEMVRTKKEEQCPDGRVEEESSFRGKVKKEWPWDCRKDDAHMRRHKTAYLPEWPFLFQYPWDAIVMDVISFWPVCATIRSTSLRAGLARCCYGGS